VQNVIVVVSSYILYQNIPNSVLNFIKHIDILFHKSIASLFDTHTIIVDTVIVHVVVMVFALFVITNLSIIIVYQLNHLHKTLDQLKLIALDILVT